MRNCKLQFSFFIHEENPSLKNLKLYKKRIENFYSYLNARDKYLFFAIYTSSYPKKEVVEQFVNKIKEYRKDFCIIIFNATSWRVKWEAHGFLN